MSTININENDYTLKQFATSTVSDADALVLTIETTDVDLDTLFADFNSKDNTITIDSEVYEGYINFVQMIIKSDTAQVTIRQNTDKETIAMLEEEITELQQLLTE